MISWNERGRSAIAGSSCAARPRVGGRPDRVNRATDPAGGAAAHAELCCGPLADARDGPRSTARGRRAWRSGAWWRGSALWVALAGPLAAQEQVWIQVEALPTLGRRAGRGRGLRGPDRGRGGLLPRLGLVRRRASAPSRAPTRRRCWRGSRPTALLPGDAFIVDGSLVPEPVLPGRPGATAAGRARGRRPSPPPRSTPTEPAAAPPPCPRGDAWRRPAPPRPP